MLLYTLSSKYADVAELVDALVLGTSVNDVGVRVPSSAPITNLFELQIQKSISKMVDFFIKKHILCQYVLPRRALEF